MDQMAYDCLKSSLGDTPPRGGLVSTELAPAATAIAGLQRQDLIRQRAFVAGQWVDAEKGRSVVDPADQYCLARVPDLNQEAIGDALAAARGIQPRWARMLPQERARILRHWAELVLRNQHDLATIVTLEQGKPLRESLGEVAYGASFLEWFAEEGRRAYGETIPSHLPSSQLSVIAQPVGTSALVTPWNFPFAMVARKAGAALAAGCTAIVKPAEETPLSALALALLAEEAGVPAGVLSVVTGDPKLLVESLMGSEAIAAVSFTGSTRVGRLLMEQAAPTVKRVTMELGGHAPFIVFDDADLDLALAGCIAAKFRTGGQDCLAANRVYVQRGVYDEFVDRLGESVSTLRVGHGLEPKVDIGPMTRESAVVKCERHVTDAIARGARLLAGGHRHSRGGTFFEPTLVADVTDAAEITREETFGPVAAVLSFTTEAEVVQRANANPYGLGAYVYTRSLNRATRVAERLECGMVGVNTPYFTGAPIPFGGWKQSGIGREGSRHGIFEFLALKYVCIGNLDAA